jgi:hypothetical protein
MNDYAHPILRARMAEFLGIGSPRALPPIAIGAGHVSVAFLPFNDARHRPLGCALWLNVQTLFLMFPQGNRCVLRDRCARRFTRSQPSEFFGHAFEVDPAETASRFASHEGSKLACGQSGKRPGRAVR